MNQDKVKVQQLLDSILTGDYSKFLDKKIKDRLSSSIKEKSSVINIDDIVEKLNKLKKYESIVDSPEELEIIIKKVIDYLEENLKKTS